jgi:hypothetical protein
MGWNTKELRVEKSPSASGSAEQWVKEKFPTELVIFRKRSQRASSALIAMIDADSKDVEVRINEFEYECNSMQIQFRTAAEAAAIAVPRRNIETWIRYLNEESVSVDELVPYPKLDRERACKPAVDNLVQRCKSTGLRPNAPSSLEAACDEYNVRIRPLTRTV